ncbi:MAG: hypothetical protein GXP48_11110 [Acidobacteria bacterium]|nr:hypothetical protein [Acidobacteriota bacterium]
MAARRILFICVGNTCRSIMAEAICRHLGDGLEVFSAGLAPTGRVTRETIEALQRLGYPAGGLRSKSLDDVPLRELDTIVSLIGPAAVSWLPRDLPAHRVIWNVPDPYGEDLETFDRTARRIERLVVDLLVAIGHE